MKAKYSVLAVVGSLALIAGAVAAQTPEAIQQQIQSLKQQGLDESSVEIRALMDEYFAMLPPEGVQPPNDLCVDAIPVTCPLSVTPGTTTGATLDGAPFCGTSETSPSVWYSITGNGGGITVDTCNGATTWDSKITVYTDGCTTLTCVDGNDDTCGLQSEVSWVSAPATEYLIMVHGFGGQSGPFELTVTCEIPVELMELEVE